MPGYLRMVFGLRILERCLKNLFINYNKKKLGFHLNF